MSDQESQNPRPLQYASPRDNPQTWTASRILAGVVIVPVGVIVGLTGDAMIVGCLRSGARDISSVASGPFVIALLFLFAVVLAMRAYQTKLLMRLYFMRISAAIGFALPIYATAPM